MSRESVLLASLSLTFLEKHATEGLRANFDFCPFGGVVGTLYMAGFSLYDAKYVHAVVVVAPL